MVRHIQVWMMAALLSGVASVALAQEMDTALLKYDVKMATALQMNNSTWVLPPGDYRLEQIDDAASTLFLLRQKKPDGTYSEPVAILDAWRVPYYDYKGEPANELRLQTSTAGEEIPVITGWQIRSDLWRLRDVAALDEEFFKEKR